MIGLACGLAVGTFIGAALREMFARLRGRSNASVAAEVSDEERDDIEVNFAAHLEAMRGHVSDFADKLAGDDPVLRERLRSFEWGGRS